MAKLWQHPFVNIFKTFGIGDWRRCSKEGDVSTIMEKSIKSTVYRISGSVPAGNYIQFPRTSSQSLGLTGNYFYLLFKPIPTKHFVVHMDVVTDNDLVIRISFSNLFREFKSTSTWLQFPFVSTAPPGSVEEATSNIAAQKAELGVASSSTRWTLLCLDLHYILSIYLNRTFAYMKSFRLCANMLVKGAFTSSTCYEPGIDIKTARKQGLLASGVIPLPREMSFAVQQGESWVQKYDHVKFPADAKKSQLINAIPGTATGPKPKTRGSPGVLKSPVCVQKCIKESSDKGDTKSKKLPQHTLPEIGMQKIVNLVDGDNAVHIHARPAKEFQIKPKERTTEQIERKVYQVKKERDTQTWKVFESRQSNRNQSLLPDPILSMKKIVGFGGQTDMALWTKDGSHIVYPCHSVIVSADVSSGHQEFFIGHTDKVAGLAFNGMTTLMASIQTGAEAVLRIWKFSTKRSLVLRQTHLIDPTCLSFSKSGSRLCSIGIDSHHRQAVLIWDTSAVEKSGKISLTAKAHTDVNIRNIIFTPFDESRLVSSGDFNIRFWKAKQGLLRSAPLELGQHQHVQFTDIAFEKINRLVEDPSNRKLYVTSKLGSLFVINYRKMILEKVVQLLPFGSKKIVTKRDKADPDTNVSLNSLSMTDSFCAVGSKDGFLRLWPFDFSRPFIEAEHEGPLAAVSVSPDGSRVLGATSTGTLGILNIAAKSYLTLMRSHRGHIIAFALDNIREHLISVSTDKSIRVWNLSPINQLYDFRAPDESPLVVCSHPTKEYIACGFTNGFLRIFDVTSTNVLAEHNYHQGVIIAVTFSPDGNFLYSADSKGGLAIYNARTEYFQLLRLCTNVIVHDLEATYPVMSVSENGKRLACIGPREFMITVLNARTLDELLRIDITSMARTAPQTTVDFAVAVLYAPEVIGHLLVATSSSRLIKLDANTGHLLSEVSHLHRGLVTAMAVSPNGKYLATAGDRLIKVWDYRMNLDINFQVFIGHSAPICRLMFTVDGSKLVSAGEAVFIWDFLGSKKKAQPKLIDSPPEDAPAHTAQGAQGQTVAPVDVHNKTSMNIVPRQAVPVPEECDHDIGVMNQADITVISSEEEDEPETTEIVIDTKDLSADIVNTDEDYDLKQVPLSESSPEGNGINEKSDEEPVTSVTYHAVPTVFSHYKERNIASRLAAKRFVAPPNQAGLKLKSVIGSDGNGRNNIIWNPDTGLFAYAVGCIVIIEDLSTSQQKHLRHHVEEISTLAAQHDGQVIASASTTGPNGDLAQICVWELTTGLCRKAFEHHRGSVQALQYSRDDRFLLSVGNYQDCTVALWSSRDYSLVTSSYTKLPIHSIQWDPFTVNEFATVGQNGTLLFWLLDETKRKVSLHVHEAEVPRDLIVDDTDVVFAFTSLAYTGNSVLFIGSSQGILSAWDTRRNACFMHWEAQPSEISVLVAKMGRLIIGSTSGLLQLWALEGIADLREPLESSKNSYRMNQLVVEDDMKLDGAFSAAIFDEALEMGIVGTDKGTIWYVNWESKSSVRLISGHKSQVTDTAFFPSHDNFFGTTGMDGTLRLWSAENFEQTLQFLVVEQSCNCIAFRPCHESVATSYQIGSKAFSTQDRSVPSTLKPKQCVGGYSDGTVRMFDLEKVEMVLRMKPHVCSVTSVAFSVDGCVIISGSEDGLLAVSSPATGITMRVLQAQKGAPITCINISKHEHHVHSQFSPLLWLAVSADRRVSIWSSDWSKDVCELVDWMTFPAPNFAPDGTVKSKDTKDWFARLPPSLAMFSPTDEDTIVYTGYGVQKQISCYSLAKKEITRTISLNDWALSMDLSPDGSLIAVGCKDRIVKLIDSTEGIFQDFSGHCDSVRLVQFTPSGSSLYSVGYNDILIWNIAV